MTTVTDHGIDWYQDRAIDVAGGRIDEIAVGSGEDSEDEGATELADEEYRADYESNNVEFDRTDDGRIEATITVQGGTEVPADTEIREMLIEVSEETVVVAIDNFDAVLVESGHTEEFTMPVQLER